MYRIFVKSIFSMFLILFLLLNLIFFFDFTHIMTLSGNFVSYHDKYVGFETLLRFFKSGFAEDSAYLVGYQNFLNDFMSKIKTALYGNWVEFSNNGGVTDLLTFFQVFVNIFGSIAALCSFIVYIVMYAIYCLSIFVWILFKFFAFLTGNYFTYVPLSPYVTTPVV